MFSTPLPNISNFFGRYQLRLGVPAPLDFPDVIDPIIDYDTSNNGRHFIANVLQLDYTREPAVDIFCFVEPFMVGRGVARV